MASAYDILGLILGLISLLAFVKYVKRAIPAFLPPARVHALEGTLTEMRALIDRLEGRSNAGESGDVGDAWADYRERLDGFSRPVGDLWLEVSRWENLGLGRIHEPYGSPEFTQRYRDLKRRIDDCHRHLVRQYLNHSYLASQMRSLTPGTSAPSVASGSLPSPLPARECNPSPPPPDEPREKEAVGQVEASVAASAAGVTASVVAPVAGAGSSSSARTPTSPPKVVARTTAASPPKHTRSSAGPRRRARASTTGTRPAHPRNEVPSKGEKAPGKGEKTERKAGSGGVDSGKVWSGGVLQRRATRNK